MSGVDMHGLINTAIQSFVRLTYGPKCWGRIMERCDFGFTEFEAMLYYDAVQSNRLLTEIREELGRPTPDTLEDIGHFLVAHPQVEALRRLLRFGGVNYEEFLHSLDDLPDRARLAVSDLYLPQLELRDYAQGKFSLTCAPGLPGYAHVMMGVLRAMADDYGALVMLEYAGQIDGGEKISITLIETTFAEGRTFDLGARTE
jgi:heme-NO-binding protein